MNIEQIFENTSNIAVIGLSKNELRDSYQVSAYMKNAGYNIIPINPTIDSVMGVKAYNSLKNIPEEVLKNIELVNVFRRSEFVEEIIDEVIEINKKFGKVHTIWMQLGIFYERVDKISEENKLNIITNKCIKIEHGRLN
uniref:CoA-binding domain-containing protein n=1 Tax=uncultured marine thaumarchaeote KM3_84_F03 TaxID=1456313 RepID=A0A075HYC6_9ARCH|nr:CoA-binding domain-containing protein [uncultured marine thaumarchaeote KM3_84_F03]